MSRIKEIISIDIGSTNSQMARKYVDLDNKNKPINWNEKNITSNLISDSSTNNNIPTVFLKWIGQGDRPSKWQRDIPAGNIALGLIKERFENDIEVIREFKKDLFYTDEEKQNDPEKAKKYEKACEHVKAFLEYLREVKNTNVSNQYEPEETKTYITVPVRSKNSDFAVIKKLAEEIRWSNVEILDEAKSALDFAIFKPDSELMEGIKKSTVNDIIHVLLIDIGGSTTDIIHVEISPDGKGSYKSDYKTQWPPIAETDTLGCIEIDKAIADLMLKKEYLLENLVNAQIDKEGYINFTKFKEKWSDKAKEGQVVPYLDDLRNLACDPNEQVFAPVNYSKETDKLGRKEFEDLIHNYIIKMQNAIRSVLNHDKIKEQELDYVVLTGGGSEMYGIEEMVLGKLNIENPLNFTKIKKNPVACIHGCRENPSAACCLGNLLDKTEITCTNHINGNYFAEVEVYTNDAKVIASYSGLKERKIGGKPNLPKGSVYKFSFQFKIAEDLKPLPVNIKYDFAKEISISSGENLIFRITVFRQNSDSETKYIESSWLYRSERTITQCGRDFLDKIWNGKQSRTIKLKNSIKASISENRKISIKPAFAAEGFTEEYQTTKEIEF